MEVLYSHDLPDWLKKPDNYSVKQVKIILLNIVIILLFLQPSFLHTDFSKWKDEDDSEGEDHGMDDNFEAVS